MARSELQTLANALVRRAQKQGYVVPNEIKQELKDAGFAEERWKEVIELVRDSLHYREGRYYHLSTMDQNQESNPRKAVETMIKRFKQWQEQASQENRRQQERTAVSLTVQVQDEDGQEFDVLSRDLSTTGIRLLSNRSLLGHKVRVTLPPNEDEPEPVSLWVRVLWTSTVGEGLFENGGTFLEGAPK
jgi:hypothetical protein